MGSTTIQWTSEEAAYLKDYRELCDKYLEDYKKQEEPDNPQKTFWTNQVDRVFMRGLAKKYPAIQARMESDDYEWWRKIYLNGVQPLTNQLEESMKAHFAVVGYDYESIPPAPYTDYTPIKVKYWVDNHRYFGALRIGAGIPYESIRLVGGLIVQSSLWNGERTWTISEATSGKKLPYTRTQTGSREAKKAVDDAVLKQAEDIARITDWSVFEQQPLKVRRAIYERLEELKDRWGAEAVKQLREVGGGDK